MAIFLAQNLHYFKQNLHYFKQKFFCELLRTINNLKEKIELRQKDVKIKTANLSVSHKKHGNGWLIFIQEKKSLIIEHCKIKRT